VQQELRRVLKSKTFSRSQDLCRFLQFAVGQKLRNRSIRLKEYLIGVAVFKRGEAFNPAIDPIVRVQARRLRSKLNLYYETEGHRDSIVIELPCGAYVPAFRLRSTVASKAVRLFGRAEEAQTERRRSVLVLPFVNVGLAENERFSDGLTDELIHALAKIANLKVIARTWAFQFKGKTGVIGGVSEQVGVDALVEGSVRSDGNRLRISAGLIDVADGGLLWSGVYTLTADEVFEAQENISEEIATKVEAHLFKLRSCGQSLGPGGALVI
jgi:TolB-like protein